MPQEFVKVATVQDIPEGKLKTVEVGSEKVVIANVGGKFYAIGAICTHKGWDLSEGRLEGETIVCAGHGSRWDLKTGQGEFVRPLRARALDKRYRWLGNSIRYRTLVRSFVM